MFIIFILMITIILIATFIAEIIEYTIDIIKMIMRGDK